MKNLFKNELRVYKVVSDERVVYETEQCYLLKVVDFSGKLERYVEKWGYESMDEFLQVLFDALTDSKLSGTLTKVIDSKKFNVDASIFRKYPWTSVGIVRITSVRVREVVKDKLTYLVGKVTGMDFSEDFD